MGCQYRSWQRLAVAMLALFGLVTGAAGRSETSRFTTKTLLTVNQVDGLGRDSRFVYVATGLEASLHASRASDEAMALVSKAMNQLVTEAAARAGRAGSWALVNVTLEEGSFHTDDGEERVVTLRGDVVVIRGAAP